MAVFDVYSDGSYRPGQTGHVLGWAWTGKLDSERVSDFGHVEATACPKYAKHHNVGAELLAAGKALQWAKENGVTTVVLHHDYEGVGAWPDARWRAKKALTQDYVKFVRGLRESGMDIQFRWVKGHADNQMNLEADLLASGKAA